MFPFRRLDNIFSGDVHPVGRLHVDKTKAKSLDQDCAQMLQRITSTIFALRVALHTICRAGSEGRGGGEKENNSRWILSSLWNRFDKMRRQARQTTRDEARDKNRRLEKRQIQEMGQVETKTSRTRQDTKCKRPQTGQEITQGKRRGDNISRL